MLLGISILVLSATFLAFRHVPVTWSWWDRLASRWLLPAPPGRSPSSSNNDRQDDFAARDGAKGKSVTHEKQDDGSARVDQQPAECTPKAAPVPDSQAPKVPSFALEPDEASDEEDSLPPPSFPALNSAQRASGPSNPSLMPPPRPSLNPPSRSQPPNSSRLMPPPPPRPNPSIRSPNNTLHSLRVPSTGPLPNRGPTATRGAGGSLAIPPSAPIKTPNPRQKVLLSPGHSPLDWANLLKSGSNLSGVDRLMRVTPSMLKANNGRKGRPCWSSYQGKVYNIGPYLPFHPGGEGELRRAAGKDGEKLFMEVHPWVNWENMLGECVVGIMVTEDEAKDETTGGSLEDMD